MESGEGVPTRALGYADPKYATALHEFGDPYELERCGGWVLRRRIPSAVPSATTAVDAMGCYPLFACRDWSSLPADLEHLPGDLVSLSLVTDPFGAPSPEELCDIFDVVVPFKHHHLIDLDRPADTVVARHHRKSARRALAVLTIEEYDPTTDLSTWCELYGHIIAKHRVTGIRAFSAASFELQASMTGMVGIKASLGQEVVGMHWYLAVGDVVYAHLAALHPLAYGVHASHGLFWTAIEMFSGRYRWIDMGGGSGTTVPGDGLSEFKAGWCSDTAPTFVCGKIGDRARYGELTSGGHARTGYFPAYRHGEFSSSSDGSAT